MTAQALTNLGWLAQDVGFSRIEPSRENMQEATQLLEEALALHRQRGDRRRAAFVLTLLAANMLDQRAYERAERLLQEAPATYREVGDESEWTHRDTLGER